MPDVKTFGIFMLYFFPIKIICGKFVFNLLTRQELFSRSVTFVNKREYFKCSHLLRPGHGSRWLGRAVLLQVARLASLQLLAGPMRFATTSEIQVFCVGVPTCCLKRTLEYL